MQDRRELLTTGSLAALTGLWPRSRQDEETSDRAREAKGGLRTITYNVLKCGGYPYDDDTRARLDVARRWMDARFAVELFLYQPDIVSFQEAPTESVVASIAKLLRMNYCFFPSGQAWPGAILTRFDILEVENCPLATHNDRGELFTRHWGRALLDTGSEELPVYSAHLMPGKDANLRVREAREILAVMQADIDSGRSLILQGDLNHDRHQETYALWKEAGLVDAFAAKGTGLASTINSVEPKWCVDYVWAHGPIAKRLSSCRVLFEGAFRTNHADPVSFALSDHIPVLAEFA